ncbi:hypothetical protein BH20ACT24_BH20ACT24_14100 [soil metagenome]
MNDRVEALDRHRVVERIWQKDVTVWRADPTEIADRLGWLSVHHAMREQVAILRDFAGRCVQDGFAAAVLVGRGGSSLAPEVLRGALGVHPGGLELAVLDTTHPDQILALERTLDLDRTLFIVASKSGTTVETLAHLAYFWSKVPDGSRFVAITDPGTPLESLAADRGFRQTFRNPADIGGRYSAMSYVGLVPAALLGADLDGLLDHAAAMAGACAAPVRSIENPGAWLGAVVGEAARAGRDKLTFVLDDPLVSFGPWVEQLLAESTGKDGRGIVPVDGEDVGPPDVYGDDRFFVGIGGDPARRSLEPLEHGGHPAVMLPVDGPPELGGEFFRWEFATAVAGAVLGIHPFDQPNVQEAKDATKRLLERGVEEPPYGDFRALLETVRPGDYLAIQAYLPRSAANEAMLQGIRSRLRDRLRVATTVGFGPRFLHSTGQLHKGGPDTGVFVQVVEPPAEDVAVPGERYSFGDLIAAQAAGDLAALRSRGRRVTRVRPADLGAT